MSALTNGKLELQPEAERKSTPEPEPTAKPRKTDRRTLYTIEVAKDALLELIGQMPYEKITVSKLCRTAEITRTTFYAHFPSLDAVLNAVIDDALMFSKQAGTPSEGLAAMLAAGSVEDVKEHETMLPACQRIADSAKYRDLFLDPGLGDYIVGRILKNVRGDMVPSIMKSTGMPEDEAELLLEFILHGSFHVNQRLGWNKDDEWYRFQRLLNIFTAGGYRAVARAR